jgi:kinesin family member 1
MQGLTNRTTAATAMNSTSSRSHAVFTLEITEKQEKGNATEDALMGKAGKRKAQNTKITLIDLAGSERAKSADTKVGLDMLAYETIGFYMF